MLRRAGTVSAEAHITSAQLRWAGHVSRMPDDRLPKAVFYGELAVGKRKQGGQKLRYKDVIKRHMKNTNIEDDTWEEKAANRSVWRGFVRSSISAIEERRLQDYARSHARRHAAVTQSAFHCICCGKACRSRAGLVAHQRACNFT